MTDLKLTDGELEEKVRFLAEGVNVSGGGTNSDDLELQDVVNSKDEVIGTLPRGGDLGQWFAVKYKSD